MISKLHYITQNHLTKSHVDLCKEACEAGAEWIQLRMKDTSFDEYLINAVLCRQITNNFNAKLIINDNVEVAKLSKADGVHLGQSDTNTKIARTILGKDFIIGGTANTYEQIVNHIDNGVDYVGVGPYTYTITKENLSPVLGLEGYQEILSQLSRNNFDTPIIAIGGIQTQDIQELIHIGIHGVAVSGLITHSENKSETITTINSQLMHII